MPEANELVACLVLTQRGTPLVRDLRPCARASPPPPPDKLANVLAALGGWQSAPSDGADGLSEGYVRLRTCAFG